MAQEEIKVGDVVKLKSGSFKMVVGHIGIHGASCFWNGGDGDIKKKDISVDALQKSEDQ
jgi:uncharacterized protein YodC (DUF2158 family)